MTKGNQWVNIMATIFLLSILLTNCKAPQIQSNSKPVDHSIWDSLLHQYVDDGGLVDYQLMVKDSHRLEKYLDILRQNHPNDKNWSKEEIMAYWINAYNAFTVELILRNYPVASIKDIKNGVPFVNTVWDIKFINIEGAQFDLNNIEHGILRQDFNDPRVHFALVCASMSCPKLQNFAFTANDLENQLDRAAKEFINESFRNEINADEPKLSKLLDWYWGDFKNQYPSRAALINKYSSISFPEKQSFDFLEYNWTLNEKTVEKRALLD